MELTPYNAFIASLLQLCEITYWDIRNENFLPEPLTFLQPFVHYISAKWIQHQNNKIKPTKRESYQSPVTSQIIDNRKNDDLNREEIKMVMNKLGLQYSEGMSNDKIAGNEIVSLFDQEEPSLDEIKEAFDVFDVNKDGFIDVVELQVVLCNLGQQEGSGLEECGKMISRFDENGDGVIDFKEFIRLMEKSFC